MSIRAYAVLLLGVIFGAEMGVGSAAPNAAFIFRHLSHRQAVYLGRGADRLARSGHLNGLPSLGIPSLWMTDAHMSGAAPLAVASSWDMATARMYGMVLGTNARVSGFNVLGVPVAPFGSDPLLTSRIFASVALGIQHAHVIAAPFGYTGGSGDARSLHERDWPPLEAAIVAGKAGAITCRLRNGEQAAICINRRTFATMLTRDVHFAGFAIDAHSPELTSAGRILNSVNHAGTLHASLHGSERSTESRSSIPDSVSQSILLNGATLLKNDANTLPLDASLHSIVIIGGDDTIASAIRAQAPQATISTFTFVDPSVPTAAQIADASIIVLSATPAPNELDLIRAVGSANPRTVVVFDRIPQSGDSDTLAAIANWNPNQLLMMQPSSVSSPPPSRHRGPVPTPTPAPPPVAHAPAAIVSWGLADAAPGALARLLFGSATPAGHLPVAIPAFAFGSGLSYTTFSASNLKVAYGRSAAAAPVTVNFEIRNVGTRTGVDTAQLYLEYPTTSVAQPLGANMPPGIGGSPKVLVAFARVTLAPGQVRRVAFPLRVRSFAYWSTSYHAWFVAPGVYRATVGTSAADAQLSGDIHIVPR